MMREKNAAYEFILQQIYFKESFTSQNSYALIRTALNHSRNLVELY